VAVAAWRCMDVSVEGGEAGTHRLESNTPRKKAKNFQENV
jgi:hypothetical protein